MRVAYNKGVPVPEGWLLDGAGRPTTEPGAIYREPRGTILPLGGPQAYKGFGIGLLLDMLAGGLSGLPRSRPEKRPQRQRRALHRPGHRRFCRGRPFSPRGRRLGRGGADMSSSRGSNRNHVAGRSGRKERARRQNAGIPLDDGTWNSSPILRSSYRWRCPDHELERITWDRTIPFADSILRAPASIHAFSKPHFIRRHAQLGFLGRHLVEVDQFDEEALVRFARFDRHRRCCRPLTWRCGGRSSFPSFRLRRDTRCTWLPGSAGRAV